MHMKKIATFFLCLVFIFSCTATTACAVTNHSIDTSDVQAYDSFVEITRDEYIREKADVENISYSDAEKIVDSKIASHSQSSEEIINPYTWEGGATEDESDGTRTVYGRIYHDYTDPSGMKLRYTVQAILRSSSMGSSWIEVTSPGQVILSSGQYTFTGSCTARLISSSKIRMVAEGYFEIAENIAAILNINLTYLTLSGEIGGVEYYRTEVYDEHVEYAPVRGGY